MEEANTMVEQPGGGSRKGEVQEAVGLHTPWSNLLKFLPPMFDHGQPW